MGTQEGRLGNRREGEGMEGDRREGRDWGRGGWREVGGIGGKTWGLEGRWGNKREGGGTRLGQTE